MNDDDPAAAHLHFSYTKDAGIIMGLGMMVARKLFTSSFHFFSHKLTRMGYKCANLYITALFRFLGNNYLNWHKSQNLANVQSFSR